MNYHALQGTLGIFKEQDNWIATDYTSPEPAVEEFETIQAAGRWLDGENCKTCYDLLTAEELNDNPHRTKCDCCLQEGNP